MNRTTPLQEYIPQQTIQCYLDALLQEAAVELALAEQPEIEIPAQAEAQVAVSEPHVVPVQTPAAEQAAARVQHVASRNAHTELSAEWQTVEQELSPQEAEPSERAAWRDQPFEALLFDVGGLTLAVPLVSLGTIHSLESDITPLFGQPDWFLGLLPTSAGNLKVLDTARWVMPERYSPALRDDLRFVISVQGYDWGMAVHGVSRSIKLNPDQIKWRSQQGKRPWLAGTVIEHMCALLDVSALASLLISHAPGESATRLAMKRKQT
ncbi:chemotaxis protein CheW [Pseudomonas sp. gcc21]|uniref:CheW domain-containing protein n=1 Tax=Pseudomonas sp. gcc21 TaxID=2726989 RepID=UPI00145278C8|nr:CheW domain-containing protein [Pseudomonas sp. gcc21]QJD58726.1 chemotaxis protein CheW [Pseudomonas sp. gcc21]